MKFILLSAMLIVGQFVWAQPVAVDTFASLLNQRKQAQLIDVRTPAEYADGHLPNAVNINSQRDDFRQALAELDKSKPVFVYCLSGGRSKGAAEKLRELGYPTVYELQGGYLKWSSKMMPVAGVTRSEESAQWPVARFDSLLRVQPVVLVDVYATWCAPCKKMAPVIDKLTTELAGQVTIIKANADIEKALLAMYQVNELPTLLLFRKGKLANRQLGYCDEATLRGLLK
ncbi:rhodanese-like domain-containing protein [Fibrella arboris]|uniref:rhodanese-like domain-containing protein n=1 Tax=Fibrella arboris TaxID=3242486 RepID=UPI0035202541